jgi:hypothetical protein
LYVIGRCNHGIDIGTAFFDEAFDHKGVAPDYGHFYGRPSVSIQLTFQHATEVRGPAQGGENQAS